jgi:hypothetical protein
MSWVVLDVGPLHGRRETDLGQTCTGVARDDTVWEARQQHAFPRKEPQHGR